jgi:2-phospho-L-lactate guanylyltransferase
LKRVVYAVIPVKDPCESKTRLSSILNPESRERLTLVMLEDVISTLKRSKTLTGIVVVSSSPEVLDLGRSLGCETVREGTRGVGLNKAVELGVEYSGKLGAEAVLILPADIPMIDPEDVEGLLLMGFSLEKPYVVVSPSKDGGTNALMLSLPTPINFRFGPDSYRLHLYEAEKTRSNIAVFHSKRVVLDIDDEKDVSLFLRYGRGRKSWTYLKETFRASCRRLPVGR